MLDKLILYGSYARGDSTEESDIDIMIILNCSADGVKSLRGLTAEMASDISLEQEVFLSILLRDRIGFEGSLDVLPFYQNIAREGIDFSKHSGVLAYFQKNYVKTGIFQKEYSKILTEAFEVRSDSDYDDYYVISKELSRNNFL